MAYSEGNIDVPGILHARLRVLGVSSGKHLDERMALVFVNDASLHDSKATKYIA